jgi:SAM-dependent methyltransferase
MPNPHPVTWTPESIARFWNRYESTVGMDLWHFSRQRGRALLRHVEKKITIREPALDLGCGSGHLLRLLLGKKIACFAADVSSRGLEIVSNRFSASAGFLGSRIMESSEKIPFDDASIGTVFLLETIEHLLPGTLTSLFIEIQRILSKNGYCVITTPWREDLDAGSVSCKNCGCIFHKTQHLRTFDEAGVRAIAENAGLSILSCAAALLLPESGVWLRAQATPARNFVICPECECPCESPNRSIPARWKSMAHELKHLVCIAQKK